MPLMVYLQHKRVTLHGLDTGAVFNNLSGVEKLETKPKYITMYISKIIFLWCDFIWVEI